MKIPQLVIVIMICSFSLSAAAVPVEYPISKSSRSRDVSKPVFKAQEAQVNHFLSRINQGLNNKPIGLFNSVSIVRREGHQRRVKLDNMTKTLIIRVGKSDKSVVSAETLEKRWQSGAAEMGNTVARVAQVPFTPLNKLLKVWNVINPVSETRLKVRNTLGSMRELLKEKMPKWTQKLDAVKGQLQEQNIQSAREQLSSLVKSTTGQYISKGQTQSLRARSLKWVESANLKQLAGFSAEWNNHISNKSNQRAMTEATVMAAERDFVQHQKAKKVFVQVGNHHDINVSAVAGFGGKAKAFSRYLPRADAAKSSIKQEAEWAFFQGLFTDKIQVNVAAAAYTGALPRALSKAGLEHALNTVQ